MIKILIQIPLLYGNTQYLRICVNLLVKKAKDKRNENFKNENSEKLLKEWT